MPENFKIFEINKKFSSQKIDNNDLVYQKEYEEKKKVQESVQIDPSI